MDGAHALRVEQLRVVNEDTRSCFDLMRELYIDSAHTKSPFFDFIGWMGILGAKTYLQEELDSNTLELLYERESMTKRVSSNVRLSAFRLTFFSAGSDGTDCFNKDQLPDESLLGYAVVVKYVFMGTTLSCIHEAVVRWPAGGNPVSSLPFRENYYIHCVKAHNTKIGTEGQSRPFTIVGSFFTQANGLTSVCAHGAIRAALNSSRHIEIPKVTNQQIDQSIGIDFTDLRYHFGKISSETKSDESLDGLGVEQMNTAIKSITGDKFRLLAYETHYEIGADFDRFVYPHMESGYPVILGINGWDLQRRDFIKHVVTILGHTLNVDRWSPEASAVYGQPHFDGFHAVCDWTDHYIIHDDRLGMYATIQGDILRPFMLPAKNPWIHPILAVAIIPNEIAIPAHGFEAPAVAILRDFLKARRDIRQKTTPGERPKATPWEEELEEMFDESLNASIPAPVLVTRVTIRRKLEYQKLLESLRLQSKTFTAIQLQEVDALPEVLAVCELTLPFLYSTRVLKLGEVVFDMCPAEKIDYLQEPGGKIAQTAKLMWFDGLWQTEKKGGADWPISGTIAMYRDEAKGTVPVLAN
jgi:hypothetical protein